MNSKSSSGSWVEKLGRARPARSIALGGLAMCAAAGAAQGQWGQPAPSGRVECLGSGAAQARIVIEGGEPFGVALMSARGASARFLQLLALDAQGSCVRELAPGDLDAAREIELWFRTPGGGTNASVSPWKRLQPPTGGMGLVPGPIVITEIMKDPKFVPDTSGEWFEILNVSTMQVNLGGWKISDLGSNQHVLPNDGSAPVLGPGKRAVLGIQDAAALNGGVQVTYKYSGITLSNGADEIILHDATGTLIDMVAYGDGPVWPDAAGMALNLTPTSSSAAANDDPANWCDASVPFHPLNPDFGTPGLQNTLCP